MRNAARDAHGDVIIGFDVGSSFVHAVVLDSGGQIVYSVKPIIHFANPYGALREAWEDILDHVERERVVSTAFTGSGAKAFTAVMPDMTYVYDSVAIPLGAGLTCPQAAYIFHIGAKDTYFFHTHFSGNQSVIQEWRTGTKCGGGSGTLIEKQCRRLFQGEIPAPELEDVQGVSDDRQRERIRVDNRRKLQARLETILACAEAEAEQAQNPSAFLARCGVVIQSDLIHKQNDGAPRSDNLAGLFRTIAGNYKIDVLGNRQLPAVDRPGYAIATGGVMANRLIRGHLAELLHLRIDQPKHYTDMAAIGTAAKAWEQGNRFVFDLAMLHQAAEHCRETRQYAPSLALSLDQVHDRHEELSAEIPAGTEVVIGIDGGSTTTKGALIDLQSGRLLDKLYIKTHGDPESSLKQVLTYLGRHRDRIVVRGIGATGSARKLYEKMLLSTRKIGSIRAAEHVLSDRITDEITCHALGVRYNNPETDTIFEIGGQDMKFTCFNPDGSVKEAKMNYSCQAGSGQTLENMADIINLTVEDSLQEAGLRAERVPLIDATCGVFMEMDENRLIAEGFSRDEIAAAILRGTAASYYYKFVGGAQNVGRVCSAQGGPPLGKAFLAALAQVSERQIEAYPHREIFGAWGQALDIREGIHTFERKGKTCETAFRGWDIVDKTFARERLTCRELLGDRCCGIRNCTLDVFCIEEERIVTGGFCPRGNSEAVGKPKTNYVSRYHQIFEKHVRRYGMLLSDLDTQGRPQDNRGPTIGIKRSTATLGEKGIWSAALLRQLGFHPVFSPLSDTAIAKRGVDNSRTEFCIATKLATGHAAILNQHPGVEYLFNPSFIEMRQEQGPHLKYCIYTESEGYVLNDVLSLDKHRQLNPILHFQDLPLLIQELRIELARVGRRVSIQALKHAIRAADDAEQAFRRDLHMEGDTFLARIEAEKRPAYVGLGRDYVLLDPEASAHSGTMFAQTRGLDYIPQVFLEHRFQDISLDGIVENEFWVQSVKILKAGLWIADHPFLFGIRLMNFGCGPDSLKIYQERRIQEAARKPLLVLVTDGQTNNAPFVTRTEAHERVVRQTQTQPLDLGAIAAPSANHHDRRTWLMPFMGNASFIASASLRNLGVDSQVLPTHTPRGYELARKHINTEVCQPLKGVVGDVLGFLRDRIDEIGEDFVQENYLVMLPTTSGPCRFGKYTELMRDYLRDEGLEQIPVVGPSSKSDYVDMPFPQHINLKEKVRFQKSLYSGFHAVDLLEDTYLRFRPYARDKEAMARLREERLRILERIIEKDGPAIETLVQWGAETVSAFKAQDLKEMERYPLVLYVGEIYMRQHDSYTGHAIDRLEEAGLELVRDPVTEWLHYINRLAVRNDSRDMRLGLQFNDLKRAITKGKKALRSLLKGWYMSRVDRRLDEPFHEVLDGRHVLPKPLQMIETLEKAHEIHGNIEGESPLTTGIAYHVLHNLMQEQTHTRICGIFHVGPFTCMQESVATAKIEAMIKEVRKQQPDLVFPIIHAFFGDSPNVNLEAEIAVFKEQCYQKRDHKKRPVDPPATIEIREIGPASGRESVTQRSKDQPVH
jgi:activator of 2-hydroxyglutaryl-CoA dehydratase/predicted nucleotide-binding protein (sugar kinase/HSP70/actin superfamily)